MKYTIRVTDRGTKKIIQEEESSSLAEANKLWDKAVANVNPLQHKLEFIEEESHEI